MVNRYGSAVQSLAGAWVGRKHTAWATVRRRIALGMRCAISKAEVLAVGRDRQGSCRITPKF